MAGLLDILNTDGGRLGLGLLAAAGPSAQRQGMGSRFAQALQTYQGLQDSASEREQQKKRGLLFDMQVDGYKADIAAKQAAQAQQQRIAQALPTLLGPQGFDWRAAMALGMKPDDIKAYGEVPNIGRSKVARTIKGMGPDGREYEHQVDEFGQRVGEGMAQYRAPISADTGGAQNFLDPYTLKPVASMPKTMTPDGQASNAVAWANNQVARGQLGLSAQRLAFDKAGGAEGGKAPAGYRWNGSGGLEFIAGGPADPNAAKKAAPTEFQGKAAMFGDRAGEADRIITSLDGKYSPGAINTKKALGSVWGVGGALESAGNAVLPANAQKAEQAERDFINAVLRLESGAAIGKDEFDNARKQYFPQPFDSLAVKEQKAANRKRAIEGLNNNARTSAAPAPTNKGGVTGSFGADNDPLGLRK